MFKKIAILGMALMLGLFSSSTASADQAETPATTTESRGAYLFEWRSMNCGDGHYFAILVGGNIMSESNTILNRGYDYPYTFDYTVPRSWDEVLQLVNIDGIWGTPENWGILPEGSQPTLRITLITNNKILPTKERYTDVVSLSQNVNSKSLSAEVRKYLINVDGSDAGAYDGTTTVGWEEENGSWRYRKSGNTYILNTWLKLGDKQYYMNEQGIMLADTITPDGYYINTKGGKASYVPGWLQDGASWKYVRKNGYYATNQWIQGADGKRYYFDIAAAMLTNAVTPDGYCVDANGVWDGQPASAVIGGENPGPGATTASDTEGQSGHPHNGTDKRQSGYHSGTPLLLIILSGSQAFSFYLSIYLRSSPDFRE